MTFYSVRSIPTLFLAVMLVAVLGGCRSMLGDASSSVTDIYTLNAPQIGSRNEIPKTLAASIQIAVPQTAPGLAGNAVAIRSENNRITYYNGAQWALPLEEMTQSLFVEALDQSRLFKAVSSDLVDLDADYVLQTDIRDFQIENHDGKDIAVIRITAHLMGDSPRMIIMTRFYRAAIPVGTVTMANIMDAFDTGFGNITNDLAHDLYKALSPKTKKGR